MPPPSKPPEKRKPIILYLQPRLRAEVDRRALEAGQKRSVWIERAVEAALAGRRG